MKPEHLADFLASQEGAASAAAAATAAADTARATAAQSGGAETPGQSDAGPGFDMSKVCDHCIIDPVEPELVVVVLVFFLLPYCLRRQSRS